MPRSFRQHRYNKRRKNLYDPYNVFPKGPTYIQKKGMSLTANTLTQNTDVVNEEKIQQYSKVLNNNFSYFPRLCNSGIQSFHITINPSLTENTTIRINSDRLKEMLPDCYSRVLSISFRSRNIVNNTFLITMFYDGNSHSFFQVPIVHPDAEGADPYGAYGYSDMKVLTFNAPSFHSLRDYISMEEPIGQPSATETFFSYPILSLASPEAMQTGRSSFVKYTSEQFISLDPDKELVYQHAAFIEQFFRKSSIEKIDVVQNFDVIRPTHYQSDKNSFIVPYATNIPENDIINNIHTSIVIPPINPLPEPDYGRIDMYLTIQYIPKNPDFTYDPNPFFLREIPQIQSF